MTDIPKKNILVVDDDEDICRMISVVLENEEYCCARAETGAQGAMEFCEGDFDLIITDLNMPAGNGIALIERIRRNSDVPIIVVTAFSAEYADSVRGYPNVTLLQKPFDAEALVDVVGVEVTLRQAG